MVASVEIVLTGAATTAGELKIVFTPQGGETVEIRTPVAAGAPAAAAASELAAALIRATAPDYAVTVASPARIAMASGKSRRPFRVKLAAEPPNGLSLRFD